MARLLLSHRIAASPAIVPPTHPPTPMQWRSSCAILQHRRVWRPWRHLAEHGRQPGVPRPLGALSLLMTWLP